MTDITTIDGVVAAIAARKSPPHWLAAAAGVDRSVLEAAVSGEPDALTVEQAQRVASVLGIGGRVLATPASAAPEQPGRVIAAARRIVAAADREHVEDPREAYMPSDPAVRAAADAALARRAYDPPAADSREEARRVLEAMDATDDTPDPKWWREAARREGVDVDRVWGGVA